MPEEKSFLSRSFSIFAYLLLAVAVVRYFTSSRSVAGNAAKEVDIAGSKFRITDSALEREPFDSSLPCEGSVAKSERKEVKAATENCVYLFSEKAASLVGIKYKKIKDVQDVMVDSLTTSVLDSSSVAPSLLFLPRGVEQSEFALQSKEDLTDGARLVFVAEFQSWIIKKEFLVKNDSYEVVLKLSATPQDPENVSVLDKPRLVFYAPTVGGVGMQGKMNAVASDASFSLKKVDTADETGVAWKYPYLFGAEDRFFLHSFVGLKTQKSILRGSFSRVSPEALAVMLELAPIKGQFEHTYSFYFGPKKISALAAVSPDLEGVLSFGYLSLLCKFLLSIMEALNSLVNNYGFAIMLLALLLRAMFWPLMFFVRRKARGLELFEQRYAAEIGDINRKYGNNLVLKTEHLSKFYAEHGVSQLGKMLPMLPELLQLPIIFALYRVLMNYVSLYNAPFVFWITDLSTKDPFFVLPGLLFVFFWIQQNFLSVVQQEKNFLTKFGIPLLMLVLFQGMPAGLVLYWVVKTALGLVEEVAFRVMNRRCR